MKTITQIDLGLWAEG